MAPKTSVKLGYTFNKANEEAVAWAQSHAGELVKGITKTTRKEIQSVIGDLMEGDASWKEVWKELGDIFDDPERVKRIAHTEAMFAANEGQKALWDQAVADGYLTGNEEMVWIVTPDDKLCEICEALGDTTVPLGDEFPDGGPPAHPDCRCTIGIA